VKFVDEILRQQLADLEDFVVGKIDKDEYLKRLEKLMKKSAREIKIVSEEEIPPSIKEHEMQHAEIIKKYGLDFNFCVLPGNIYAVTYSTDKMKGWSKEKILDFLWELHTAPKSYSEYDHLVYYLLVFYWKNKSAGSGI